MAQQTLERPRDDVDGVPGAAPHLYVVRKADLRRWLLVPALAAALAAVVAAAVSMLFLGEVRSQAVLLIDPGRGEVPAGIDNEVMSRSVATQERIVVSEVVLSPAAEDLGLRSWEDLADHITATADADTQIMRIAADGEDVETSQARLEAVVESYRRYTFEADNPAIPLATRVAGPLEPEDTGPAVALRNGAIAAVLAALAALGLTFVRSRLVITD
jgi:capsular polysaccharide biosynthesis protein